MILSGSTARGTRTQISDLDYHLVGTTIETRDLSPQLDLHVLSDTQLESAILEGDDFIQWSLRFGRVVFDDGVLRDAARLLVERRPWPNVHRKFTQAGRSVDLARRFVATGDEDGALVQVRTALLLAARARLLRAGVFPLSRAELPSQLRDVGLAGPADALEATIHEWPSLEELVVGVEQAELLLGGARDGAA